MKVKLSLLFFILILSISCHNSTSPNYNTDDFGIFLLKDTSLVTIDVKNKALDSIKLQDKAIINLEDIIEYDWENQVITLTTIANKKFKNIEKKMISTYGLPFIVVAENQKIYLGNIYPGYSSYIYLDLPSISIAPFIELRIEKASENDIEDKTRDNRIYRVLKKYNKIK